MKLICLAAALLLALTGCIPIGVRGTTLAQAIVQFFGV